MGRCFSGQAEASPCPDDGSLWHGKKRRKDMTKIVSYFYALALVICLGTTAMLAVSNHNVKSIPSVERGLASDGAFRDGLYLGKLAAEGGQAPRLAIGRWSADQDRSMFAAGYRRGYSESLASAAANSARTQSAE
jgi:hypothetical protein